MNHVRHIPDTIYLQITKDELECVENDFNNIDTEYVTWSQDRINDTDIKYQRNGVNRVTENQHQSLVLLGNFWLNMIKSNDVDNTEIQTFLHAELAEKLYKDLEKLYIPEQRTLIGQILA